MGAGCVWRARACVGRAWPFPLTPPAPACVQPTAMSPLGSPFTAQGVPGSATSSAGAPPALPSGSYSRSTLSSQHAASQLLGSARAR